MYEVTLRLIAELPARRPDPLLPTALHALFRRLAASAPGDAADATEDCIWHLWMVHPNRHAEREIDLATGDIAARRYDLAETRLARLLRRRPDFAEAWHKQATLYYLLGSDDQCVDCLHRALQREPRHFGALLTFAEVLLGRGAAQDSMFSFRAALRIHPNHARAREVAGAAGDGRR